MPRQSPVAYGLAAIIVALILPGTASSGDCAELFANDDPRMVPITSSERLDVDELGERLQSAQAESSLGLTTPGEQVLFLLGGDDHTRLLVLEVEKSGGELADSVTVSVWRDGFMDDSVRGDWHEVTFVRGPDGELRLASASKAWRCWRGSDSTYHTDLCP